MLDGSAPCPIPLPSHYVVSYQLDLLQLAPDTWRLSLASGVHSARAHHQLHVPENSHRHHPLHASPDGALMPVSPAGLSSSCPQGNLPDNTPLLAAMPC